MESRAEQRKLAAIMFTDMVGYSALAQRDEKLAIELLDQHRRLLRSIFPKHDGREIETMGDGFLVEFASAVLATECAIEIQNAIAAINSAANANRRFRLRIGLHVGDVIQRDGKVMGDGVNIAARIEPLAEPGGICLSQTVYDQVRNKLAGVALAPLDRPTLKNIRIPLEVYRVVLPGSNQSGELDARVEQDRHRAERPLLSRRLILAAGLAGALLFALGWWRLQLWPKPNATRSAAAPTPAASLPSANSSAPRIDSIAVLPLENLSGDPAQEFFADGLTEELISQLARIASLRVLSRTSVMHYKHPTNSLPEIGQQLKADALVEGSVRKSGSRVRVTVTMFQASTDHRLWNEQYDRDMSDVLSLQGEVALAIARQIKAAVTPDEGARLAAARPVNPQAYEAYIRGRISMWQLTRPSKEKAREYYQEAIRLDPNFALAYAGLADYYISLSGVMGDAPALLTRPKAKEMALRAIKLDPDLSEAHTSLAWNLMDFEFNWEEAGKEFDLALKLNPNNWQAHFWYGFYLAALGRFDEAVAEFKRTKEFDPLYPVDFSWLPLFFARRYDESAAGVLKALSENPNDPWGKVCLAQVRVEQKRYAEAIALLENLKIDGGANGGLLNGTLARAAAALGDRPRAERLLKELMTLPNAGATEPTSGIAMIYAALGNKEEALTWLERGFEQRSIVYSLKVEPYWDSIRTEPRFKALLAKMHLPPD